MLTRKFRKVIRKRKLLDTHKTDILYHLETYVETNISPGQTSALNLKQGTTVFAFYLVFVAAEMFTPSWPTSGSRQRRIRRQWLCKPSLQRLTLLGRTGKNSLVLWDRLTFVKLILFSWLTLVLFWLAFLAFWLITSLPSCTKMVKMVAFNLEFNF